MTFFFSPILHRRKYVGSQCRDPVTLKLFQADPSCYVSERMQRTELPIDHTRLLYSACETGYSARERLYFTIEATVVEQVEIVDALHLLVAFHNAHDRVLDNGFEALAHSLAQLTEWLSLGATLATEDGAGEYLVL